MLPWGGEHGSDDGPARSARRHDGRQWRAGRRRRGAPAGPPDPQPPVHQVRRLVRRRGAPGADGERRLRRLFLLQRAQGLAHPHPARAGRGGGGEDRPVRQGDREPARLDDAAAVVGRIDRPAAVRCAAPAAPGAGDHRARAARRHRQGAPAGLAPRHGRRRQRDRPLEGPEIHRGGGQQGLLRPGLFPPRVGALHDAGDRRDAARRRRQRRRGEPQADLGRGLADQGRRARPCLCGRRAGPADRASGHQPGPAQHRYVAARAGARRARRRAWADYRAGPGGRQHPGEARC